MVEPPAGAVLRPSGAMQAVIQVVIVNFNAGEALSRCVNSVLAQDLPVRVTVVDNASSDDSIDRLRQSAGAEQRLAIKSRGDNPGFARAVNRAVGEIEAGSAYLLILNPDCEMSPGSLSALRDALDSDSLAALAAPAVVDAQGRILRGTLRRFPDPWNSLMTFSGLGRLGRRIPAFRGVELNAEAADEAVTAEAVSGACMLLKTDVFLDLGCMDGAYGLHCEDLDLMYRIRERGMHCLYVPQARVFHQQGLSSGSRPLWVHWQKHRGMQRFFMKFQAARLVFPLRWLVVGGIWLRFVLTLPLAWFRS